MPGPDRQTGWTAVYVLGALGSLAAAVAVNLFPPTIDRLTSWLATAAAFVALGAFLGRGINGDWRGVLIDGRNRLSLTRLQVACWTVLVSSAYLAAAMNNARDHRVSPLAIAMPRELWLLMGIAASSMVAAPLIQATKVNAPANEAEKDRTFALYARQTGRTDVRERVANVGQLVIYKGPTDARWSDLFQGEEVGNLTEISIGKVQLFYVGFALLAAYATALGELFSGSGPITSFPTPDPGLLTILGISNLGHLSLKAVPASQRAGDPSPPLNGGTTDEAAGPRAPGGPGTPPSPH